MTSREALAPSWRSRVRLLCCLGACCLLGCAPDTRFRRTALIPAARPLPWNGRGAKAGSLRLEGAAHLSHVQTNLTPEIGDTAVNVPQTTLDGAAAIAVTNGLELGARYSYSAFAWSDRSTVGTMPIPSRSPVQGWGPEIRGTIWLDDDRRWALGIGGNLLFYRIPTALWEQDPSCMAPDTCATTLDNLLPDRWRLVEEETERSAVFNVAIYPSVAFGQDGKYGHLFGGISVHEAFENDGFTNSADGPPIEGAGFIWFFGAGYGVTIDAFRAAALGAWPLTTRDDPVNYQAPSLFFTVGGDISLWRTDDDSARDAPRGGEAPGRRPPPAGGPPPR